MCSCAVLSAQTLLHKLILGSTVCAFSTVFVLSPVKVWGRRAEQIQIVRKGGGEREGGGTCESCCENEDTPIPAMHHGLWQLFPLPGGVSCGLGEEKHLGRSGTAYVNH